MTDIPIDPPAQRLTVIAEQLDGKLIAGAFDGAAPDEIRELVTLGRVLRGIAREIAPRPPVDIIRAIREAATEGDLADAWTGSRARRLDMPATEQALVVMEWIDRATTLAMDDGR